MSIRFLNLLFILIFFSVNSFAQNKKTLNIYFLRHIQTVANVTNRYNDSTESNYSDYGKSQLKGIPEYLKGYKFDAIIVSPKNRTICTIYPYLKANNLMGEIWPEVAECCWHSSGDTITPSINRNSCSDIVINDTLQMYFKLREDAIGKLYPTINYFDGKKQVNDAYNLLKEKYFNTDKTILIVSHALFGARLFEALLNKPYTEFDIKNAKLNHFIQQEDGTFKMLMYNGKEVK